MTLIIDVLMLAAMAAAVGLWVIWWVAHDPDE